MTHGEKDEKIRERLLSIIDSDFDSDVSFERAMGLKPKTVNNWRRGRSSSYMKMIPELAKKLGVNLGELFDIPIGKESSELSDDEIHLLTLYRKSASLPKKMKDALSKTLQSTIEMYITSASELRAHERERKRREAKSEKKPPKDE